MSQRSGEQLKAAIIERLGFFPPFFAPALSSPRLLENLWQQTTTAYLDNPIPNLFKEKLAAMIARYCSVPYCLLCHSASLKPLGMSGEEVLELLDQPALSYEELAEKTKTLGERPPMTGAWPEEGSELEESVLHCSIAIFLNHESLGCLGKLRKILGDSAFDDLTLFIAYNRTCIQWAEAHPELSAIEDQRVQNHYAQLLEEAPALKEFFKDYQSRMKRQQERRDRWLSDRYRSLLASDVILREELRSSKDWLAATLESIVDAVLATTTDAVPKVSFMNRVAEKLTGWTAAEAKGRVVTEIFRVLDSRTRTKQLDPVMAVLKTGHAQTLADHSVLISREGSEYLIEDSAAPILNEAGKIEGVVLVFRDVTARKKLEQDKDRFTEKLSISADNLRNFFMQSPLPMVILDGPEHRFTLANLPYEKLVGRSVHGKTMAEAFEPQEVEKFMPILDQVYRSGVAFNGKELAFSLQDEDGVQRERVINAGYQPAVNADGETTGILAIFQDVTEEVALRRAQRENLEKLGTEKEKLEAVFAESIYGIAILRGENFVFEKVNAKWRDLVSSRDYIGRTHAEVYQEFSTPLLHDSMDHVFRTGIPFHALELKLPIEKSGGIFEDRFYNITYDRLLDGAGKPYGIIGHCMDVSDRVRQQRRLEVRGVNLERERDVAERESEIKSSFLANMSHEIRTPLGAIMGFAELLKDTSLEVDERARFVNTISRNSKALTRIIDDILDLAKVESGKLDIEVVDTSLAELTHEVMELFTERVKAKGIFLKLKIGPEVPQRICSDPTRLRQILINLVGNAVKFTEQGGVFVTVNARREGEEANFEVHVKDTGLGISDSQKLRLFQPFVQADSSTTRKFGGTGLGLVLSARLALALGGDITITDNNEVRGTIFTLRFRAHLPQTQMPTAIPAPEKSDRVDSLIGMKVLVADDSKDNLFLVERLLKKKGATVETVGDGAQAYRRAMVGNFDVVLMDIQMPILDGYEATRALRDAGYRRPIIALTAHAMAEERARSYAAGCDGHLTKPLNSEELVSTLREFGGARGGRGD